MLSVHQIYTSFHNLLMVFYGTHAITNHSIVFSLEGKIAYSQVTEYKNENSQTLGKMQNLELNSIDFECILVEFTLANSDVSSDVFQYHLNSS